MLFNFSFLLLLHESHLDATVAPVSNNNVSIGIHGNAGWSIELTISLPMGAKFKQELSVRIVHLSE